MKRLITAATVIALLAGGCSSGARSDPVGTLTPLGGRIEILAGPDWTLVTEQTELSPGDQVRSDAAGSARLQVSDAGSIELGPSSRVRLGAGGASELMQGAVLAEGSGLSVQIGRAVASPEAGGAFRVDRALSTRIGNYRGVTHLAALGGPIDVPPLTQAIVVAHAVPSLPAPLQVDPHDAWDKRILGSAINVGLDLVDLERRVRSQLGDADAADTFSRALDRRVSAERVQSLMNAHPASPGRVFLSLAVASNLSDAGGVLPVARGILHTLESGASWIVVVAALNASQGNLVTAVAAVLASIPGLLAQGALPSSDPGGTTSPPGGPSPSPSTSPTPPVDPCADGTGEGCQPPPCAEGDSVCETVNGVIDRVGGTGGDGGGPLGL